jgi:hypothetical protein
MHNLSRQIIDQIADFQTRIRDDAKKYLAVQVNERTLESLRLQCLYVVPSETAVTSGPVELHGLPVKVDNSLPNGVAEVVERCD